jgi:hypothetical protein
MKVSDAKGFRLQVKTEDYAYHVEIEESEAPELYKVRYGRGLANSTYLIPKFVWLDFLTTCKELGVFSWDEIYDFPSYGGEGWFVAFHFSGGHEISFAGRLETPLGWAEFMNYVQYFTSNRPDISLENTATFGEPLSNEVADDMSKSPLEREPELQSDFIPDFLDQKPGDYRVKLEDLFTEEELSSTGKNAFDRQVAKFSSFVKTGSHTFVNLIMDSFDEDKEETEDCEAKEE